MDTSIEYAKQLDVTDPLAHFRERFVIADDALIYLDGNSMGRMPKATAAVLAEVQGMWSERLIRSWGEKYFHIGQETGALLAQIVGARPDEVVIAESTTVNLFKLATAALRDRAGRTQILTDDLNFPSDIYALEGIADLLGAGHEIEVVESDGVHGPADELIARMSEKTALVTLSYTVFKSAYTYDMVRITEAAHTVGALVLWDLSHSVGSVEVDLNRANADLAIGCTYKYVNGGPGSNAFLYVRKELQDRLQNPIQGWMGQRNQFDFGYSYERLAGIEGFLTGTPTVLSMVPIKVGVGLLIEAGMENVREKSVKQSDYLIALWEQVLKPLGYELKSPIDPEERGSHVSLGHPEGWRITQCLIEEFNIIPDFRAPDNIRIGITPLYTTYQEIWETADALRKIVEERLFEGFSAELDTSAVT